ncbi:MAG: hypothetical protein RLN88_06525 [Ekhidna sp.]|uniref:hypothetical protein n=1 Tax=Ekhidna sp. TaxID=2608089 RepID=UPI0032EF92CC
MRALLTILITLYWLNAVSQEVVTDWEELADQTTLNEYIENQAYSHLNFTPTEEDTTNNSGVQISHSSTDTKLFIRDKASITPSDTPLIVINGYPIERQKILNEIILTDIQKISLLKSNEQSEAIYGIRGKHGVVLIEMNKRKWKKLSKREQNN